MLFSEMFVKPEYNGTLITGIYRKPTNKEQYLHWDSHQQVGAKYSVINTLSHRVKIVSSTQEILRMEKQHKREVLTKCKYPS